MLSNTFALKHYQYILTESKYPLIGGGRSAYRNLGASPFVGFLLSLGKSDCNGLEFRPNLVVNGDPVCHNVSKLPGKVAVAGFHHLYVGL